MLIDRCKEVRSRLGAYIDGELVPGECERLAHHLAGCPQCRHEERVMREALDALRNSRPAGAPAQLYASWRARIAEPVPARRPMRQVLRPAAGLAAALALAALVRALPLHRTSTVPAPAKAAGPRVPIYSAKGTGASAGLDRQSRLPQAVRRVAAASPRWDPSLHPSRPKRIPPPRRAHKHASLPGNFLDVTPSVGLSARQQIAAMAASTEPRRTRGSGDALDGGYIPVRSDRIHVGKRIIEIHTAYRPGEGGFPAAVNVNVSALRTPEVEGQ